MGVFFRHAPSVASLLSAGESLFRDVLSVLGRSSAFIQNPARAQEPDMSFLLRVRPMYCRAVLARSSVLCLKYCHLTGPTFLHDSRQGHNCGFWGTLPGAGPWRSLNPTWHLKGFHLLFNLSVGCRLSLLGAGRIIYFLSIPMT